LSCATPLGVIGGPIWTMTQGRTAVVVAGIWVAGALAMLLRLISRLRRERRDDETTRSIPMALLSVGAIRGRQTWRIDTFRKSPRGSLVLSGGTKTWGRFSWVSSTPTCFCIRGSPELARAQLIPAWSSVRCAITYRKTTGMEDNSEAKPLAQIERHSYSEVGWISRQNLLALRSRENFFLDIPPQKQTQDCRATVIWRPSLAAFF
jgi:hypothetical protein